MRHNILINRRFFWSLAFAATALFLAHGDAGAGSRSLKCLWESRDRHVLARSMAVIVTANLETSPCSRDQA